MANLGWDEVKLPNPVFEGDTLYSQSKSWTSASRSRASTSASSPARTTGFNQDGEVVISFKRTLMVYKRGQAHVRPIKQAMQQKRRRRAFTAAYKAEVVGFCREGDRSIPEIARDLDLTESSVRRWVEWQVWDNAVVEAFYSTLKVELVHRYVWATRAQARQGIFDFIEVFYNRRRLHSTLAYRTPDAVPSMTRSICSTF